MVKVKCGWCGRDFSTDESIGKAGYGCTTCSHCGRLVSSSMKEKTDNVIGRKHIHRELRNGDVV